MSKKINIQQIVQEEIARMIKESKEKAPKLEKELEAMRVKFFPDMLKPDFQGQDIPMEKRVQIQTVSELLDVPVNELMLYFLNGAKLTNGRSLVEYHLGHVYFYAH